jgi:hypothetical protein
MVSMDRKIQILLVAGIIVTLVTLLINFYLAGIIFVILVAIVMSLMIMQDSGFLPDIAAELKDDAKAIVIRNTGNATAMKIHVALVPENLEFDLPILAADEVYEYPLGTMMKEVKVVVSFENEKGNKFSRTFPLSAYGGGFDPLKPMIPLFGYK